MEDTEETGYGTWSKPLKPQVLEPGWVCSDPSRSTALRLGLLMLYKEDLRMCLADREVSNLSAEGRKHMTVTFDQPSGRRQERDPFPLSQASVVIGHLLRIQELCHPL